MRDLPLDTPCSFVPEESDRDEVEFAGVPTGTGVGMDEDISLEIIETTSTMDVLKLWPWVNQVIDGHILIYTVDTDHACADSLDSVSPTSIRNRHATFQKDGVRNCIDCEFQDVDTFLSPRVILVEDHGTLVGLVTVKDVLRFTVHEGGAVSSWDERRFEGIIEELWTWTSNLFEHITTRSRNFLRR